MIRLPVIAMTCCALLLTSPLTWGQQHGAGSWGAAPLLSDAGYRAIAESIDLSLFR